MTPDARLEGLRTPSRGFVVIGGGLAGLAAALEFVRHGLRTQVLEQSRTVVGWPGPRPIAGSDSTWVVISTRSA